METRRIKTPTDIIRLVDDTTQIRHRDSLIALVVGRNQQGEPGVSSARIDFPIPKAFDIPHTSYVSALTPCLHLFDTVDLIFLVLFSGSYEEAHMGGAKFSRSQRLAQQAVFTLADALTACGVKVARPVWAGFQRCGHFDSYVTAEVPAVKDELKDIVSTDYARRLRLPTPRDELLAETARLRAEEPAQIDAVQGLLRCAESLPYADREIRTQPQQDVEKVVDSALTAAAVIGAEVLLSNVFSRDIFMCWLDGSEREFSPLTPLSVHEFLVLGVQRAAAPLDTDSFLGTGAQPPDSEMMFVSICFLRVLAGYIDTDYSAALYAVLGWLEWGWGRTSFAEYYVDTALELEEDYELARLLKSAIDSGVPAAWVQNCTCAGENNSLSAE